MTKLKKRTPDQILAAAREALTKAQGGDDPGALLLAQAWYADASSALDRHRDQIGRADPLPDGVAIGARRGIETPPRVSGGTR